jgi:hypothetical protein
MEAGDFGVHLRAAVGFRREGGCMQGVELAAEQFGVKGIGGETEQRGRVLVHQGVG